MMPHRPSRKVTGYVKAVARWEALRAKLDARERALDGLRHRVRVAHDDVVTRRAALTGGQLAAATRALSAQGGERS